MARPASSPLLGAGNSMLGGSVAEAPRLLATAYDNNWKMKKVLPKDCIPLEKSMRSTGLSRSRSGTMSPKKQGFDRPLHGVNGDGTFTTQRKADEPTSPKSDDHHFSPKGKAKPKGGVHLPHLCFTPETGSRKPSKMQPDSASSESRAERERLLQASTPKKKEDDGRVEHVLQQWAKDAGVPFDLAQQCLEVFVDNVTNPPPAKYRVAKEMLLFGTPFDAKTDLGSMNKDGFGNACLRIADAKDFSGLPAGFLEKAMATADKDGSGCIDFDEFLYFYYKFSFSEEVLIPTAERQIRAAARQYGIAYDEIGNYQHIFHQTDTDQSGHIDFDEFQVLVRRCLKVPDHDSLPAQRYKDMWREASRASGGRDLDFLTFVGWYRKYFMGEDESESPFEAYYHNIRRVSCYDSNEHH